MQFCQQDVLPRTFGIFSAFGCRIFSVGLLRVMNVVRALI